MRRNRILVQWAANPTVPLDVEACVGEMSLQPSSLPYFRIVNAHTASQHCICHWFLLMPQLHCSPAHLPWALALLP